MRTDFYPPEHSLIVPIYNQEVIIFFDDKKYKAFEKYMTGENKVPKPGYAACADQISCRNGGTYDVIHLRSLENHIIFHEIGHVCFHILDRLGIPVENGAANEAYCYMLGYLSSKILSIVVQYQKTLTPP